MIDSHAHVAYFENEVEREGVILRAREAGVSWIEIGTDVEQSRRALSLASDRVKLGGVEVYATIGVHPSDVATGVDWGAITKLLDEPKVVAVGEVGIDLHHSQNLEEQIAVLERFVELAREKNLPMVFHVRDPKFTPFNSPSLEGENSSPQVRGGSGGVVSAHDEMIKFLTKEDWHRGVIHTFSGTPEQAKKYLELGLYLSFSGVVTYKNAGEIAEVAKTMPLEKILIETDCPFLTPEPFRGKQNEPSYVKYVAEKIASLRSISFEEVARATEENTRTLFRL